MGRIPESAIAEIRNRVDIVDLVGRYVSLKKAGANHKGLCPFHNEKSPSFNVNSDRQIFHCFGCGEGGDVVSFLMKHDNLTFPEAARSLARECGVEIPETESRPGERGVSERIFQANDVAQGVYHDALRSSEGEAAREYLAGRGLVGDDVSELEIGFAPDRWDAVAGALSDARVAQSTGIEGGLLAERKSGSGAYDRLRGRVTFPIRDVRGRIIGFGGRALAKDQEPKYLNTPETPVFKKREAFYGFPAALEAIRRSGRAILCEGYFDRIALHRAGMKEGLATCGTALTREHAKQLKRRTKTVVLLFDGDGAGQKAMERSLEVLVPEGLRVHAALLPDGQDPDDLLESQGPDALRGLVDEAPMALDLVIRLATSQGVRTAGDKADVVDRVAPLVALVPNAVEREAFARALAGAVGASEQAVDAIVRGSHKGERRDAREEDIVPEPVRRAHTNEERGARLVGLALLRRPQLASNDLRDRIALALTAGEPWNHLALAIADAMLGEAGPTLDVHQLGDRIPSELREPLLELAANEHELDKDIASEKIIEDVLGWFEKRHQAAAAKALTREIGDPNADKRALLAEKQRMLEERRAALAPGRSTSAAASSNGSEARRNPTTPTAVASSAPQPTTDALRPGAV